MELFAEFTQPKNCVVLGNSWRLFFVENYRTKLSAVKENPKSSQFFEAYQYF
jgi:hypothetical protein